MRKKTSGGKKFAYFVMGLALPIAGFCLWSKKGFGCWCETRKQHIDRAHDITVEDSFPASDPPSAW